MKNKVRTLPLALLSTALVVALGSAPFAASAAPSADRSLSTVEYLAYGGQQRPAHRTVLRQHKRERAEFARFEEKPATTTLKRQERKTGGQMPIRRAPYQRELR